MKGFKMTLIFAILVLAFSGCGEKNVQNQGQNGGIQPNNTPQTEKVVIKSGTISEKIADYTEVISYMGDCDGDGTDETVVLSTAAEKDAKGEFLWNDGQNWALYIKDNSGETFVLYDGYVQAGNVYFDVSDYYMSDGTKPVIMVTVTTGAGLTIKNYEFSKADSGYVESNVYDTKSVAEGGINRRFTSVPEILK